MEVMWKEQFLQKQTMRTMTIEDFEKVYDLWLHTEGMGSGNAFWEKAGFTVREDLVYRNRNIHQLKRIDT